MNRLKIQDPTICYIQEMHFRFKDTYRPKAKRQKKDIS